MWPLFFSLSNVRKLKTNFTLWISSFWLWKPKYFVMLNLYLEVRQYLFILFKKIQCKSQLCSDTHYRTMNEFLFCMQTLYNWTLNAYTHSILVLNFRYRWAYIEMVRNKKPLDEDSTFKYKQWQQNFISRVWNRLNLFELCASLNTMMMYRFWGIIEMIIQAEPRIYASTYPNATMWTKNLSFNL